MGEKIVVGMSGGVDSSMCIVLLKKMGYEPIGVALKLPVWENELNSHRENVCCSDESLCVAQRVCDDLGVPFHIIDIKDHFKNEIMDYFTVELRNGRTPNPCVKCNRVNKFQKLFEYAKKHGIKYASTGHYAKIEFNKETKEFELKRPKDLNKDQTYGLSFLPQEYLSRIILPLGDYTKQEVYEMAKEEGFEFFLKTQESQDLCFVSGKGFKHYIKEQLGEKIGEIVDEEGNVLGKHKGVHFFTIGQRKGLNLLGRYIVKEIKADENKLIVTQVRERVSRKELFVYPFNFTIKEPTEPVRVEAKIRYRQTVAPGTLYPRDKDGRIRLVFDEAQEAVTPGQFCVVYQGELCLGAGVINKHEGKDDELIKIEPVKDFMLPVLN